MNYCQPAMSDHAYESALDRHDWIERRVEELLPAKMEEVLGDPALVDELLTEACLNPGFTAAFARLMTARGDRLRECGAYLQGVMRVYAEPVARKFALAEAERLARQIGAVS